MMFDGAANAWGLTGSARQSALLAG